MPLTSEEQAELDALIAEGNANKAKAEDPKTPSPLEQHMDEIDSEGAQDVPRRLEKPLDEPDNKAGFLERLRVSMGGEPKPLSPADQMTKEALPQVPVGSQDRVLVDALTRGWGDKAIAGITGSTVEEQRAKTQAATIEAGDSAGQFKFAGEVAPYFALGAGAGGIIRAGMAGAGLSMADRTASTEGHEDRLPDGEEMLVSGLFGMGGGVVGSLVGRIGSGLWNKVTHGKETLPGYVRRAIEREGKVVDNAGKAMDASGVVVSSAYLKRLSKQIEKDLKDVTPDGTPKAWMALERVRAGLNTGRPLTLRQINELRRGVSEINGKNYEQKYINDIGGAMNRFMEGLPNSPKNVVKGDTAKGVAGWKVMNRHFQDKLKMEKMAQKYALAYAKAQSGKKTFDGALQDEFGKWTQSKAGQREFENIFTKEERKVLMPLTTGSATTQTFNRIDRIFAKGYLGNLLRVLRASLAHAPASQIAKEEFGKAFAQMPGGLPAPAISQIPQRAVGSSAIAGGNELYQKKEQQQ